MRISDWSSDVCSSDIDAFGGRITDMVRPVDAGYGAKGSYHKTGQAVDFVPRGGVGAISRAQIRALMAANGIRIVELLGPGEPGPSDHWPVAFRAEERRGGQECARTCTHRWSPLHQKKQH